MDIKDVYMQSAAILEEVQKEHSLTAMTAEQTEFLSLKLMAAVIHNDVCREYYDLFVNTTTGTSRLLVLASIIMKLFEAHLWYSQIGNKRLRNLAQSRGMHEFIESTFKDMKRLNPNRIEKYSDIRNELGAHYSYNDNTIDVIDKLYSIPPNDFFEDVKMMVLYGQEWLKALRAVWKLQIPDSHSIN